MQQTGIDIYGNSNELCINEIKIALKNDERVELRGWGVFSTKNQKSKTSRNPKTGEKVIVNEKKSIKIHFSSGTVK